MKLEKALTAVQPLQNEKNSKHMTAAKEKSAENRSDSAPNNKQSMDGEQAESLVSQLNETVEPLRTNLKFELHDKLGDYYVKVVNRETDEVIREIPPEKMLDMHAAMAEFMGFLVDETI